MGVVIFPRILRTPPFPVSVRVGSGLALHPTGPADINIPVISLRLCTAGVYLRCARIGSILLDTGSSGLRLFASALPSTGLPELRERIGECYLLGTVRLWGRVSSMKVGLGGEETEHPVPVQIIDRSFGETPPVPCSRGLPSGPNDPRIQVNGILGISPERTDGGFYFLCPRRGSCRPVTPEHPVENPLYDLPVDHKGFSLSFPPLKKVRSEAYSGVLTLGLDTRGDNRLSSKMERIPLDGSGTLRIRLSSDPRIFRARPDTGTSALALPASGFSRCPRPYPHLSCTDGAVSLRTEISRHPVRFGRTIRIRVESAKELLEKRTSIGGLLFLEAPPRPLPLLLGMPFFFGRTVAVRYPSSRRGDQIATFFCRC